MAALARRGIDVKDPVVVLGVLEVPLGGDPVAGGDGIPGQGKVLVQDLLNRAPNLGVRAVAIIGPR